METELYHLLCIRFSESFSKYHLWIRAVINDSMGNCDITTVFTGLLKSVFVCFS